MRSPIINLWFENQAETAAAFYTEIFGGEVTKTTRYGEAGQDITGGTPGSVLTVYFTINGHDFIALNGGKQAWSFNPAISIVIPCDSQAEVDRYWDGLLADGGTPVQCGWLTDKFGISWQIVPHDLDDLVGDPSSEASQRAMKAMLSMVKIDIDAIRAAYDEA